MTPADRIAQHCATRFGTTRTATTSSTTRKSPTTRSTRCCRNCRRSSSEHPELVTPDSPTQRVAGRPVAGFRHRRASFADAQPGQRLRRRRTARVRRAVAQGRGRLRRWRRAIRRRAEDRWPEHRAHLRGRPAERGATRGDGGRGEDVTANVRTIRPCHCACARDRPAVSKCAARCYLPRARVRARQPRARRRRRAALRQPTQCRCRDDAQPRFARWWRAAGSRHSCTNRRGRTAASAERHSATLRAAAPVGAARSSRTGGVPRHRGRHRVLP